MDHGTVSSSSLLLVILPKARKKRVVERFLCTKEISYSQHLLDLHSYKTLYCCCNNFYFNQAKRPPPPPLPTLLNWQAFLSQERLYVFVRSTLSIAEHSKYERDLATSQLVLQRSVCQAGVFLTLRFDAMPAKNCEIFFGDRLVVGGGCQ